MWNVNSKSPLGDFGKWKATNRYLVEASFADLILEGERDAFWLYLKCKTSISNHTRAISENEKQKTITSPKPALPI
jgi:hypothetical protein